MCLCNISALLLLRIFVFTATKCVAYSVTCVTEYCPGCLSPTPRTSPGAWDLINNIPEANKNNNTPQPPWNQLQLVVQLQHSIKYKRSPFKQQVHLLSVLTATFPQGTFKFPLCLTATFPQGTFKFPLCYFCTGQSCFPINY